MNPPILNLKQLSQSLRGWRKARGLTQAQTGTRVGLLPKTISGLESHPEESTLLSLFKLLSALDLELEIRPKQKGPNASSIKDW